MVITGGGGYCYAETPGRARDRLLLYSGGLIAQLVVLALSITYIVVFGSPRSRIFNCYLFVFTVFNAMLFFGNIIPYRSNDGSMIVRTIRGMRNEA